eukprot:m.141476 g.141476  ORF g.141476 m.141476 type:complete len:124 (+) comp22859_c0_seq2:295-666(+)
MGDPLVAAAQLRASVGSSKRDEIKELLAAVNSGLHKKDSIYTAGSSEHKALLHAATIGHFQLGQYKSARSRAVELVELDPADRTSIELKVMVENAIDQDGKIGLAILGGVAAAAAAVALIWRR